MSAKNPVLDIVVGFAINIYKIWFECISFQICSWNLKYRYFAIIIALFILSTNIIVFGISLTTSSLDRKNRDLETQIYRLDSLYMLGLNNQVAVYIFMMIKKILVKSEYTPGYLVLL